MQQHSVHTRFHSSHSRFNSNTNMENSPSNYNQTFKNGFRSFCEGTSMHGFLELYKAKSKFWIWCWLIVISFALAITSYQVYQAVDQYINQSSSTTIEPVKKEAVRYPQLKYCFAHWLKWLDLSKAHQLNFSRESVYYGLSYLTSMYIMDSFNVTTAKQQFVNSMSRNNLTTLFQFYKSIAMDIDYKIIIETMFYNDEFKYKAQSLFNDIEFVQSERGNLLLCYVASSDNIVKYFTTLKESKYNKTFQMESKNVLQISIPTGGNDLVSSGLVYPEEYKCYVVDWMVSNNQDYTVLAAKNFPVYENPSNDMNEFYKITIPDEVFIDGFNSASIRLLAEIDTYAIIVKASAHRFRNSTKINCIDGLQFLASNTTCTKMCANEAEYFEHLEKVRLQYDTRSACLHINEFLMVKGKDFMKDLCWNRIVFINVSSEDVSEEFHVPSQQMIDDLVETPLVTMSYEDRLARRDKMEIEIRDLVNSVRKNCFSKCIPGCEKWNFDFTMNTQSMYSTFQSIAVKKNQELVIEYPPDGDILIMIDTDSQSWENFVGNVGGLLGIWTGASILSCIQLFYLCCCSESNFDLNCCKCKPMKSKCRRTERVVIYHQHPNNYEKSI